MAPVNWMRLLSVDPGSGPWLVVWCIRDGPEPLSHTWKRANYAQACAGYELVRGMGAQAALVDAGERWTVIRRYPDTGSDGGRYLNDQA